MEEVLQDKFSVLMILKNHERLTHLNLENLGVSDEKIETVSKFMEGNNKLELLNLKSNRITAHDFKILAAAVNTSSLQVLNLRDNQIGILGETSFMWSKFVDVDFEHALQALSDAKHLREVNFGYNGLTKNMLSLITQPKYKRLAFEIDGNTETEPQQTVNDNE
jgi:Leucine-rich repeat (LRR) protein